MYFSAMNRVVLFSLFLLAFNSCQVEECEDPIPYLEFDKFEQNGDSANMVLIFRDCDGDFGLDVDDDAEYDPADSTATKNLFMFYNYRLNSEWVEWVPDTSLDQLPFYYTVPVIENRSVSNTLEGEIHVDMEDGWSFFPIIYGDTFRFRMFIVDRALNQSNEVITPIIIAN